MSKFRGVFGGRLSALLLISFLGGCASQIWSTSGEEQFWQPWMEEHHPKPTPEIPPPNPWDDPGMNSNLPPYEWEDNSLEKWEKFEAVVGAWMKGKLGKLSVKDALKQFPNPTQRRTSTNAVALGWYFDQGRTFEWDLFIVNGQKMNFDNFILVLGFDNDGVLQSFEFSRTRHPSSSIGVTTRNAMQVAITYASYQLMANMLEKALKNAGDHWAMRMRESLDGAFEDLVQRLKDELGGISLPQY